MNKKINENKAIRKTFIRFFTTADFEEQEKWLREKHKDGWKFVEKKFPGIYVFEKCEPQDMVYRMEFTNYKSKDYKQIMKNLDWEYVDSFAGWLYFRKPADTVALEEESESFFNSESRYDMVCRIGIARFLFLPIFWTPYAVKSIISSIYDIKDTIKDIINSGSLIVVNKGVIDMSNLSSVVLNGLNIILYVFIAIAIFILIYSGIKLIKLKSKYKKQMSNSFIQSLSDKTSISKDRQRRKTFIRFFTMADFEEQENWLKKKHKNGLKFVKKKFFCFYVFEECKPQDVIYRIDFKNFEQSPEYLEMIKDFGWEYVESYDGWLYFRKFADAANSDEEDELFSDNESKVDRVSLVLNKRFKSYPYLFLFSLPVLVLDRTLLGSSIKEMWARHDLYGLYFIAFIGIIVVISGFTTIYCGIKLKKLKNKYKK